MIIHTIGFTRKSAEQFFATLSAAGVRRIVDTRLYNTSQLSGFAKQDDLRYFLRKIASIEYHHEPLLAPTADILDDYKKKAISWPQYEEAYVALMQNRQIESRLSREDLSDACLLCSEADPHHCHRRLAAEYLSDRWGDLKIDHLR
jgi:uncharacterized protein (DUF488 family)